MTHHSFAETQQKIADYVRREGNCLPGEPELIDADPLCPVWKVPIIETDDQWQVPPPQFWYACPHPILNLYRDDHQLPHPWLPVEGQDPDKVVDYIKSFHLGVCFRLLREN